jgi:hypothetical protein
MGIFKFLKNGKNSKQPTDSEFPDLFAQLLSEIKEMWPNTYSIPSLTDFTSYQEIKNRPPIEKAQMVLFIAKLDSQKRSDRPAGTPYNEDQENLRIILLCAELLSSLLRMKLEFKEAELISLLSRFRDNDLNPKIGICFSRWPIGYTVIQIEKHVKIHGLSDTLKDFIIEALRWSQFEQRSDYWGSDLGKSITRFQGILGAAEGSAAIPPYQLPTEDVFGSLVNESVSKLPEDFQQNIYEIFHLALTASAGKPTKKYLKASREILSRADTSLYRKTLGLWMKHLIQAEPIETTQTHSNYTYTTRTFLHERNSVLLKGLIWSLVQFHDKATTETLAALAERSFKKIPEIGPTCAGVGNACIYTLAHSKGFSGIGHLSRLKLKISQKNTRTLIGKYIQEGAEARGISPAELEDIAIPDFGLAHGSLEAHFDGYTLRLSLTNPGKTAFQWTTSEGTAQKTTPSFIAKTKKHSDKLQQIRATAKQIQKHSIAQRDRIDRSYIEDRSWSYTDFTKYYLHHGLVSPMATTLIWILEIDGTRHTAIWRNECWEDAHGKEIHTPEETSTVRLWHPISSKEPEVLRWRDRLETLEIRQALKQAYREIYIITDAEISTRLYSNRMAAHILKQHQLNSLAGLRNWKYSLLGCFDDGRDGETATLPIPAHQLTAEYWINALSEDDAWNDTGIFYYVSTDQVRFVDQTGEVIELLNVPKIVFSEIMRDVDLFVGVSSVGNDPQWTDNGGLTQHRDYWHNYSFGNLSELAKTRKTILEKLIPRLKIGDKLRIDGNFLRVQGTLREYKIHIGSSNILMEPNDQYLCIVTSRKSATVDKMYLPFVGDSGLSSVISKAILLAADNKITDGTILSQINR